jgi:hypothetical protein
VVSFGRCASAANRLSRVATCAASLSSLKQPLHEQWRVHLQPDAFGNFRSRPRPRERAHACGVGRSPERCDEHPFRSIRLAAPVNRNAQILLACSVLRRPPDATHITTDEVALEARTEPAFCVSRTTSAWVPICVYCDRNLRVSFCVRLREALGMERAGGGAIGESSRRIEPVGGSLAC